jgi:hypothetical protein
MRGISLDDAVAVPEDPRWMTFDTWQRICDPYGWRPTFARTR